MITNIFQSKGIASELNKPANALFIQLMSIIKENSIAFIEKVDEYKYSDTADEYVRIISHSMKELCIELGIRTLDKPEYKNFAGGFDAHRIFQNYIFDETIDFKQKISLLEIIFRKSEDHLMKEIRYIEDNIPIYKEKSQQLKALSRDKKVNYYNIDEEKLKKAEKQLSCKKKALDAIRQEINYRLKKHKVPLTYHNGFFHKDTAPLIEDRLIAPLWQLLSDVKYKNVETELLDAFNLYEKRGRDPALYAAKALESMIKITCKEQQISKGTETTANHYVITLYNHRIIIDHEKEELTSMFRIRNSHAHGSGDEIIPQLTMEQELRFLHSCMIWIYTLSKRFH